MSASLDPSTVLCLALEWSLVLTLYFRYQHQLGMLWTRVTPPDYHLSINPNSVHVSRVAFSSESPQPPKPFGLWENLGVRRVEGGDCVENGICFPNQSGSRYHGHPGTVLVCKTYLGKSDLE